MQRVTTVVAWNIFSGQQKTSGNYFQHYKDKESLYFCAFCFQRLEIMQGVLKAKVECTCKMSLSWTIYNITKRERSFCTTAFCWSHWSLKWKLLRLKQKQNVLCIGHLFLRWKKWEIGDYSSFFGQTIFTKVWHKSHTYSDDAYRCKLCPKYALKIVSKL